MPNLKRISAIAIIFILTSASAFSQSTQQSEQSEMYYQKFEDDEFESYENANSSEVYDPYEKLNRKIYAFNDAFDRYFFEHVAKAYRKGVPKTARKIIRNFLNNLSLPISAANSVAQGRLDNSLATISNFLINTTVGLGGMFDVAQEKGIFYKREDFGQTLGHYGTNPGAYLVIPFLGPSSTRDFSGWATDKVIDPLGFNLLEFGKKTDLVDSDYRITIALMSGIDSRESLLDIVDDVRKDSFDPYATIRSAYSQKRAAEIKN